MDGERVAACTCRDKKQCRNSIFNFSKKKIVTKKLINYKYFFKTRYYPFGK